MKKILLFLYITLLVSCNNPVREVINEVVYESISLEDNSIELSIGSTYQLNISYNPSTLPAPKCTYSTSSQGVVSISETGLITALNAGSVKVTVIPDSELNLTPCECTVVVKPILSERITLNETSMTLKIGETKTLRFTLYPTEATNRNVNWESSNTQVATVQSGLVTAIGPGTAVIKVIAKDNASSAECKVTVSPTLSERITLSETTLNMKTGETKQLTFEIYPSETSNKEVEWESLNTQIATVNNGLVTAIGSGTAIVRVKTKDKASNAECTVTVSLPTVEGVMIDNDVNNVLLMVGETFQLKEKVLPENAGNKNVTWTIENNTIASISPTGLITAKNIGETTAKVTTVDGRFTATIPVKVTDITGFIYALKSGSSTISTNGYVTGSINSTLRNRHKTLIATVTKFEVIDNKTNVVIASREDGLGALYPSGVISLSYSLRSVYLPDLTFKWYYTFEGKEYTVSHLYD